MCLEGGNGREEKLCWFLQKVGISGNEGVSISDFTRSATLFSFLGHLYSCLAGTPGTGEGNERKAVVKFFWPAWRYFRSAARKIPGF